VAGEKILVVDDEPGVRAALEGILTDEGFEVVAADSGEAGLETVERERFDAVLLDVWLPGIDGLETLKLLRDRRCDAEVVMISGHGNIETAVRATKLGAFDFVEKPLSLEKTLLVLRNALRQRRLERRNRQLLEQLTRETEIAGRSSAADVLRGDAEVAAASDAPVLIVGEPGSGRETIARRIHSAGRFAGGPFVELPCGALDVDAASTALFGAEGAGGRIDMASGGSLFLEDVGRLDPGLQRRLASRLLAESRGERAARLIASVDAGDPSLDESLLRCLDVIHIDVAPLRERREDIEFLAEKFMRNLAREYGREPKRLSPDCLLALKAHAWPGNGARSPAEDLYREFATLAEGLRTFERYYVSRIMAEENAETVSAARRLGIDPAEIEKRLRG